MIVTGTLVEDKIRRFKSECAYFTFNKYLIYTHDGASAKFNTNSQETDNSVGNSIVSKKACTGSESLAIKTGAAPFVRNCELRPLSQRPRVF